MDIWQETFPLRFGGIDRSDRLTLNATFDFFQEAAISHAEQLGVGRNAMASSGQVWVLSRISVLFERRPRYGETITVRSWPRGTEKLFALRDYDILDESGKPAVRGRSGWLILDMVKRRPLRPQQAVEGFPRNDGLDALPGGGAGLNARDGLVPAGERRAAYSDIDYNGHVNNTRYVQWILDVTDPEILEGADKLRLDINYLSEVKYGEVTGLWTVPLSGASDPAFAVSFAAACEGRVKETGQPAFRAELRTGTGQ
ncbi:MAG: acyl-ACP thioesterase [Treponema sp.]|jgi:acyl-ACP thioesterase|nr:acyl-ACP thioesterase [Treponema sp.]